MTEIYESENSEVNSVPEIDPSSNTPIVKWSEQWWAEKAKPGVRRCTGRSKRQKRCLRAAMDGTNVCPTHGGKAPQVQNAARRRLAEATDRMAKALLKMAVDPAVNDAVKLKAMTEALDRGGVSTKTTATVEVTAKRFEDIFDTDAFISGGNRSDYRRAQGISDDDVPTALVSSAGDALALESSDSFSPIDVEFSDDDSPIVTRPTRPISRDDAERQPYGTLAGQSGPFSADRQGVITPAQVNPLGGPLGPSGPAVGGMLSLEDAVEAQAAMARDAATRAPIRRALPPGRSS